MGSAGTRRNRANLMLANVQRAGLRVSAAVCRCGDPGRAPDRLLTAARLPRQVPGLRPDGGRICALRLGARARFPVVSVDFEPRRARFLSGLEPRPRPNLREIVPAVPADEFRDPGRDLGPEARAVEDTVMADLRLEVIEFLVRGEVRSQLES